MSETTSFATSDSTNEPRRPRIRPSNPFIPFDREAINGSVSARFEHQVSQHADKVAIQAEHTALTYEALNRNANRLARAILTCPSERQGAIALLFGHGAAVFGGMLGVLKAGRFYVPLDASYPRPRIAHMLEDAQAQVILTDATHLSLAQELAQGKQSVINVDDLSAEYSDANPDLSIAPDSLAFILYTSGSTGQPKGVVHSHRGLLNWICGATNSRHICAQDRVSLLATQGFSAAVSYIYMALLNGATLCPYDIKRRGLAPLADWLRQEEITLYQSTPTVFRHFAEDLTERDQFSRVRLINLGGEAILHQDVELYRRHFPPPCLLRVSFASTEAGLVAEDYIDHRTEIQGSVVPPGRVVEGVEVSLWGENGPVGANEIGEIVVKSRYLSGGYWQRPELTQAAFLPDPDGSDARLYRTGDLGKMLADGTLVHLGRKDRQVKIRGQRVEVAEAEAALYDLDTVKEAAVVALDDQGGEKRLVAYVVPSTQRPPTASALRSLLSQRLPGYMIPSAFVMLDTLPLTATGKVDRRALPAPGHTQAKTEEAFIAPQNATELQLAKIWEDALGTQPIGIRDDFFELGGHSLLAVQIFYQIEMQFGKRLPLATILRAPTIEQLADILQDETQSAPWSSLMPIQPAGSRPPFFFVDSHGDNVLGYHQLAQHMGADQPFYGLRAQGLDGRPIGTPRLEDIAAHYIDEIRTVQPQGPYYLGGWRLGGTIAYEMARQLHTQGQEVALLAMVQSPCRGYPQWLPGTTSLHRSLYRLLQRIDLVKDEILEREAKERLSFAWHRARITIRNGVHRLLARLGLHRERGRAYRHRPVARALAEASERYEPRPYAGRATIFGAAKQRRGIHPDPTLGWGELIEGEPELREIPGYRMGEMAGPRVRILAEQLRSCIDKALAHR